MSDEREAPEGATLFTWTYIPMGSMIVQLVGPLSAYNVGGLVRAGGLWNAQYWSARVNVRWQSTVKGYRRGGTVSGRLTTHAAGQFRGKARA